MDKLVHPGNGVLLSTKNKWATNTWNNMEEMYMLITKWKESVWKGYMLYDSSYMTKRQNYGDSTREAHGFISVPK